MYNLEQALKNLKHMSERDVIALIVEPLLLYAGWDIYNWSEVRRPSDNVVSLYNGNGRTLAVVVIDKMSGEDCIIRVYDSSSECSFYELPDKLTELAKKFIELFSRKEEA